MLSPLVGGRLTPLPYPQHVDGRAAPVCISTRALQKRFPVHRALWEILRHPLQRPETTVLHGVTVDIRQGELFGVLGLNGAGKTTLLKLIGAVLHPDAGSATVDGFDVVTQAAAVRQGLALVTADERSLHWRLSALENLRLFAGLHGMARHVADERIRDVLDAVGLGDTGRKMAGAFSSGMKQRLLVARALLAQPRILLLDEPTRSLDPLSAHAFRRMLRDVLIGERGTTVVLATHNTDEAFAYCDRVAVLHRGAIAAIGSAGELGSRFLPDRYQAWTSRADHPAFPSLAQAGRITDVVRSVPDAPDMAVTFDIPGGEHAATHVLRALVEAGVPVSRFERVPVALSELIERIAAEHDATQAQGAVPPPRTVSHA